MQLKTHPVVNLIVGKCDVILEGRIPGTYSFQYDVKTLSPYHTIS